MAGKRTPIEDRLWPKVDKSGTCWEWTATKNSGGYGRIWNGDRLVLAHRATYELLVGPIPDGAVLDHLCRNPGCVNPNHLQPVSQRTNVLRGETVTAANATKTFCVNGHEFTPENTIVRRFSSGRGLARQCRTCRNRWERNRKRKRRAEVRPQR